MHEQGKKEIGKQQNWNFVSCHDCGWQAQGESSFVSSTFSATHPHQDDLAEQRLWWNMQNKPWRGCYLDDCWVVWILFLFYLPKWTEHGKGAPPLPSAAVPLSQKPSSQECVFSARSWLLCVVQTFVRYTKPFQLLKSYQLLHAWFEQNRSCT